MNTRKPRGSGRTPAAGQRGGPFSERDFQRNLGPRRGPARDRVVATRSGGDPVTAAVLTRHELLWVLEQCGADAWPYPLRAVAWDAETEDETVWHRRRTEDGLRCRGLLQPAPARLLLAVGELVRDWHVAVDLVHRASAAPRAVAGLAAPGDLIVVVVGRERAGEFAGRIHVHRLAAHTARRRTST